jgi:hypothetical protein
VIYLVISLVIIAFSLVCIIMKNGELGSKSMGSSKNKIICTITSELDGSSPYTRVLLATVLWLMGDDETVTISRKELLAHTGLSGHHLREGVKQLKAKGYIRTCQTRSVNDQHELLIRLIALPRPMEGLPIPEHTVHMNRILHALFGELPKGTDHHETCPDENLTEERPLKQEFAQPVTNRLKAEPFTRLVLAILLCFADESGTVDSLGFASLSALTGRSEDRIRHQLKLLRTKGYISSWVSSQSSPLFGQKPNIYRLAIDTSVFAPFQLYSVTMSHNYIWIDPPALDEAQMTFWIVSYVRDETLPRRWTTSTERQLKMKDYYSQFLAEQIDFNTILHFFQDSPDSVTCRYYQAKLEQYAAYILNNHYRVFDTPKLKVIEELVDKIIDEIVPNGLHQKITGETKKTTALRRSGKTIPDDVINLVNLVYGTAYKMANDAMVYIKAMSFIEEHTKYIFSVSRITKKKKCIVKAMKSTPYNF